MKHSIIAALLLIAGLVSARQPNVIIVMTDDQGYGDLRCHGNPMIKTPNLDRLHTQAVRFTDFHVDPTCSPTRAALLTGRYSTRTGVWHTIMGRSILFKDEVTLAQMLGQAGYRTGIFGKWHLGDNYPSRPQDRGFQEVLIHGGGGVGQTPDAWGNDYFDDAYCQNGQWKRFEGYCTKVFFDGALDFISKSRNKPFFCYIPTNVPHSPNNVAEKYSRPYENQGASKRMADFFGMITEFDENFGRLLNHLDQLGIANDTILIFMTDNGTADGIHRQRRNSKAKPPRFTGFNAGMRNGKGSQYDGGHRVPFFIRWPGGGIGGGRDVNELTAHIDVVPTLAELCGFELPKRHLDGRSLVPLIQGKSGWEKRTLFAHFQREEIPPKWARSAVMTKQWRLIDGKMLYDIKKDPGQRNDLALKNPTVVNELRAEYEDWWKTLEPSFEEHGWIVVGTEHENPSRLNCHDWHGPPTGMIPWNQTHFVKPKWVNGCWMVEFAQGGTYEFTLRQKPAVANTPIEATMASVTVGNREVSAAISEEATAVQLIMDVEAGKKRLQTTFTDGATTKSRGAFFVDIRRIR
ncbi:MAG: N-acetylgalactosamine 6-sulfate sulfatase [Verrucomicrobiales bacterium]|nr:N-acetylgalactosamine 6-sulfate sulfatase [Verrucomicrobiales bacterium]